LDREQKRYRDNTHGDISKVKHYGNSSTGTLREHLRQEHQQLNLQAASNDDDDRTASVPTAGKRSVNCKSSALGKGLKQLKLSFRKKLENSEPFTSQYELNHDLAIWAELDLQPYGFTQDEGMSYFFQKNLPQIQMPSRDTVARLGLSDVYNTVMKKLKDELSAVLGTGISIMFNGWTDKHKNIVIMVSKLLRLKVIGSTE